MTRGDTVVEGRDALVTRPYHSYNILASLCSTLLPPAARCDRRSCTVLIFVSHLLPTTNHCDEMTAAFRATYSTPASSPSWFRRLMFAFDPTGSLRLRCPVHLRRSLLLLLLLILCSDPLALGVRSVSRRQQQHHVWYNGLFISGIAVDESSGDVFFSDAAANRVVRQSANGTVLAEYRSSFYSPMQLALYEGKLYVADSTNNRVAVIDVESGQVSFSTSSSNLGSCDGVAVNSVSGRVYAVDGWGISLEMWASDSDQWSNWKDLTKCIPPQAFLASVSVEPSVYNNGSVAVGLTVPIHSPLCTFDEPLAYQVHMLDAATAVHYWSVNRTAGGLWYALGHEGVDEPMQIIAFNETSRRVEQEWNLPLGAATPFYGWAMYVDSDRNMYVSDRGVDEHSRYGRVVKVALNGTELGQWSMSDGTAYSFSSIWYDDDTTAGDSCAFWMADVERGMVRVAADGSLLLPFYAAPIDPVDNRTAVITNMAGDTNATSQWSTIVLLDSSDSSTTKLWLFVPNNGSYTLLNTSSAQLGANITGVAINMTTASIYLSNTRTRTVIRLHVNGALDESFSTSGAGFVAPAGITLCQAWLPRQNKWDTSLCVADTAYNTVGAVLLLEGSTGRLHGLLSNSAPSMLGPVSVTFDKWHHALYAADSNGLVFQFSLQLVNYYQTVHQPIPAASNIPSMTVSGDGNLYVIDSYSRRLIILRWDWTAGWAPSSYCTPPTPFSSSSSSTSASPNTKHQSSRVVPGRARPPARLLLSLSHPRPSQL